MRFQRNRSLKKHSTFRIGGTAEYFFEAGNTDEALKAIESAKKKKVPWRVIGGGSNILFPEGKIRGLVISMKGKGLSAEGETVTVFAGVPLGHLIQSCIERGLGGLESLSGIPGTVGGAVYGNAGAYGHSIAESIQKVEIFDGKARRWLSKRGCGFSYRASAFQAKRWVILQATFSLSKRKRSELQKISINILRERLKKYPLSLRCPGSFFKNPLVKNVPVSVRKLINTRKIIGGKIPAGYLLEEVGARGMRLGGIRIADYHGNLFINDGNGTEKDVKRLAKTLKKRVKEKFGIILEEEVRIWSR